MYYVICEKECGIVLYGGFQGTYSEGFNYMFVTDDKQYTDDEHWMPISIKRIYNFAKENNVKIHLKRELKAHNRYLDPDEFLKNENRLSIYFTIKNHNSHKQFSIP